MDEQLKAIRNATLELFTLGFHEKSLRVINNKIVKKRKASRRAERLARHHEKRKELYSLRYERGQELFKGELHLDQPGAIRFLNDICKG